MIANKTTNVFLNIMILLMVIAVLFPILLVVSISLSSTESIMNFGYSIIPREFSLEAYKFIFQNPDTILRAYGVTITTTVVGAGLSVLIIALYAYAISRNDYKLRKFQTYYLLVTMLFHGGMVASYIVNTTIYHIDNKIWAMILPHLMDPWHVFILRTFYKSSVPVEIIESGKLDGASEWRIFFQLVIPIAVPGIAVIALYRTIVYWNDWMLAMLYIVEPKLYNLQFMLQQMMQNIQQLNENVQHISNAAEQLMNIPSESARMALCMVTMGPILVIYPFFQRYFIQGLTVGSVKG